jgi:hypothetical protein
MLITVSSVPSSIITAVLYIFLVSFVVVDVFIIRA